MRDRKLLSIALGSYPSKIIYILCVKKRNINTGLSRMKLKLCALI